MTSFLGLLKTFSEFKQLGIRIFPNDHGFLTRATVSFFVSMVIFSLLLFQELDLVCGDRYIHTFYLTVFRFTTQFFPCTLGLGPRDKGFVWFCLFHSRPIRSIVTSDISTSPFHPAFLSHSLVGPDECEGQASPRMLLGDVL